MGGSANGGIVVEVEMGEMEEMELMQTGGMVEIGDEDGKFC